jgi:hypothetical protein
MRAVAENLPEGEDHDDGVGEVEERRHKLIDLQLRHEVEEAVGRHVHRRPARHDERSRKKRKNSPQYVC